jgi:hypothetical protein
MTPLEYRLLAEFEQLKVDLADERHRADRLRTLAHWARPLDRGLPHALLGKSVDEVLGSSFWNLSATPGIGPKKIEMLICLLRRVAAGDQSSEDGDADVWAEASGFDASQVSEADWQQWQVLVQRWGLQSASLGYFSASLRDLPTVLWHTPLGAFEGLSLQALKRQKTYGEKRVAAVLTIFHRLAGGLKGVEPAVGWVMQLRPALVVDLERWVCRQYASLASPSLAVIRGDLVLPLLNQLAADGGDPIHHVAAGRLGIEALPESVRRQARKLGVTRARVYQLIDTSQEIMQIRWPEGYGHFHGLTRHWGTNWPDRQAERLFAATRDLLYPLPQPSPARLPAKV